MPRLIQAAFLSALLLFNLAGNVYMCFRLRRKPRNRKWCAQRVIVRTLVLLGFSSAIINIAPHIVKLVIGKSPIILEC